MSIEDRTKNLMETIRRAAAEIGKLHPEQAAAIALVGTNAVAELARLVQSAH